jgi:hypothetical protein
MTVNLGLNNRMEALQQSVVAFQVAKKSRWGKEVSVFREGGHRTTGRREACKASPEDVGTVARSAEGIKKSSNTCSEQKRSSSPERHGRRRDQERSNNGRN